VACCVLDGLLAEHQYVVNAEDNSLNYNSHFSAKRDFERTDLLKIFQFCLRFLTTYQHEPQNYRDLDNVLKILETILCWNFTKHFLPRRVAGVIETEATPTFKPPNSWQETINDNGFVPIFFNVRFKQKKTINRFCNLIILIFNYVSDPCESAS
jgi:hypothetical protein